MTDAELDELDRLAGAATPPPWVWNDERSYSPAKWAAVLEEMEVDAVAQLISISHSYVPESRKGEQNSIGGWPRSVLTAESTDGMGVIPYVADRDFIAAARVAVPALVAEVRRLRDEVAGYEERDYHAQIASDDANLDDY